MGATGLGPEWLPVQGRLDFRSTEYAACRPRDFNEPSIIPSSLGTPSTKGGSETVRKGTEINGKSPLLGLPHQRFPETPRDPSAVILPAKLGKYVGHKIKEKSLHLISMIKKKKKKKKKGSNPH